MKSFSFEKGFSVPKTVPQAIYVNLPVADLRRARQFFEALGYSFNEQFCSDEAAGLVISDSIYAMLHTHDSLQRWTDKRIADARESTEVLLALQLESREAVDDLLHKALAAGGREAHETNDHGYMYERAFEDLDGHIWEAFFLDASRMPRQERQ